MRTGETSSVLAAAVPAAASTPSSNAASALIHSVRDVDGDRVRIRAGWNPLVGAVDHLAVNGLSHRRTHAGAGPGNRVGVDRDTPGGGQSGAGIEVVLQRVARGAIIQQALRGAATGSQTR